MKKILFIIFMASSINCFSNSDTTSYVKQYNFSVYDGANELFTMYQFNQNYLSLNRLFWNTISDKFNSKQDKIKILVLYFIVNNLVNLPLIHQEAHRSILTYQKIGSISQPFINSQGNAYVKGVRDSELIKFRNSDLPMFIRLHTAGTESDLMLAKKCEQLFYFNQDKSLAIFAEIISRKIAIFRYFIPTLFEYSSDVEEEENELDRDIVGRDIYGAVKNLYRPKIKFYRYTDYEDLSSEEQKFIKVAGYLSLLNLISPSLINKQSFRINKNIKYNFSASYTLSPFGHMIDENLYLMYKDKYRFSTYFRQFINKQSTFYGLGLSMSDFNINERIKTQFNLHLWYQPKDLSFTTDRGDFGSSFDFMVKYFIGEKKDISINLGFLYKTQGYLPEENSHSEKFRFRIGTSISIL